MSTPTPPPTPAPAPAYDPLRDAAPFCVFLLPAPLTEDQRVDVVTHDTCANAQRQASEEAEEHYTFDLFPIKMEGEVEKGLATHLPDKELKGKTVNVGVWPATWEELRPVISEFCGEEVARAAVVFEGRRARDLFANLPFLYAAHRYNEAAFKDDEGAAVEAADPPFGEQ
jgi:hypothetical protein